MRINVVIPVFERGDIVRATLNSVAAQTLPPHQVIIVDDGSSAATRDMLETWRADRADRLNIELIAQANSGVAAARNRGLAAMIEADAVAFLDSDDIWPPEFIAEAAAILLR